MTTIKLLTKAEIHDEHGEIVLTSTRSPTPGTVPDAGSPLSVILPIPKRHPEWVPKLIGDAVDETLRRLADG